MKILLIRFSSLGDVILTTPVMNYLKMVDTAVEITLLTDKNYVELFADDPRLKSVVGFKKHEPFANLSIFNEVWDLVVDLQNSKRSKSLVHKIKKYNKLGTFHKLHFHRTMLLLTRSNLYPSHSDVITRYLKAAGIRTIKPEFNKAPELHFKQSSTSQYEKMIQSDKLLRPTIALFPFSAWKNKEWPFRHFTIVAKYFITKGWNVVLMGNAAEQEQAEQLRALVSSKVIVLAGKLSLYECGCVLSKCQLALGNDSGLAHLARACGVKTGVIYGPTTHHLGFYPSGKPDFRVFEQEILCRPCHPHGGNHCLRFNHDCMLQTTPEAVVRGLLSLHLGQ